MNFANTYFMIESVGVGKSSLVDAFVVHKFDPNFKVDSVSLFYFGIVVRVLKGRTKALLLKIQLALRWAFDPSIL